MQKNHIYLIATVAIIAILLAATVVYYNNNSKNNDDNNVDPPLTPTATPEEPEEPDDPFPVTVTDDDGTEVTINSVPQRIVSLAPSSTEALFAVGAGDQVIGVTDFCDYPQAVITGKETGRITSIGNYWMPAIEPIIALEPDLVIACGGGASDEAASKLRSMGYTVIVLDPHTVNDVINNLDVVGKATGHEKEAISVMDSLYARVDAIANKIADITDKPKIYVEISDDPLMTVGPDSYMEDLIVLAGGKNIFDDALTPYPVIGSEGVISKNPDIILSAFTPIDSFSARSGWSSINAIKNDQVYKLEDDGIYVRPGPRFIDALEDLSQIIHPDIFA
ncbi:MAG: cobalamin-binding protein [Nitrososphaerota archaeon]|jgi:iron complex transport system substrate-binding protein|nr:cobalamin-binding protein [Nitrososphaerota archaeon]